MWLVSSGWVREAGGEVVGQWPDGGGLRQQDIWDPFVGVLSRSSSRMACGARGSAYWCASDELARCDTRVM